MPRRDPALERLVRQGLLAPGRLDALEPVAARYAVAITPASAALVDPEDPDDPLGLQFLPDAAELERSALEADDPIGDGRHAPLPGLVHRYPDRVLLMPTRLCASYCRFCFRREVVGPGEAATLSPDALAAALAYIADRPQIWEVILTGGDPLVLAPRRLAAIMAALEPIAHVRVVRIHTRVPSVAPERVTPALVEALRSPTKAVYVALHANHPRELTPEARAACGRLVDAGLPMVSQTVILRGVNDDPAVLEQLMRAFVETRVKPYYLHVLDRAPGVSRFEVELPRAQDLAESLRGRVSGLCQPTLVLDIPGGAGKVPAGRAWVEAAAEGGFCVRDPGGGRRRYP